MKDFFMKHYNDSKDYGSQLKLLNVKQRNKFVNSKGLGGTSDHTKSVNAIRTVKNGLNLNLDK